MMLTHSLKSKQFWLTIAITTAITVVLCGLGVWQLQRLQWKNALIDSFNNPDKILSAPSFEAWEVSLTKPEPVLYFGYYIPQSTILVPKNDKTIVYMPFKASNGVIVMMRRGTVDTTDTTDMVLDSTSETNKIISLVGVPMPRPKIVPGLTISNPGDLNWPFLDWSRVKERFSEQPLAPYVVAVLEEPESPMKLTRTPPELRNEHLQYAIFWFFMAGVAVLLFSRFLIFSPGRK